MDYFKFAADAARTEFQPHREPTATPVLRCQACGGHPDDHCPFCGAYACELCGEPTGAGNVLCPACEVSR